MKKFLAIVAIAAFMTSCGENTSSTETKTDSTVAPVTEVAPSTDSVSAELHADSVKVEASVTDSTKAPEAK